MTHSHFTQLRNIFEHSVDKFPENIALICNNKSLCYEALDNQANQLANYLINQGVNSSHSVAIFLERSLNSYISILAILKTGASYVPIDVEYPDDRVNYILNDMPFQAMISASSHCHRRTNIHFPSLIVLDELQETLSKQSQARPAPIDSNTDSLCYVIYTSGSTGKPKGVEVMHSNICHYIEVASNLYQMTAEDKIYQGFSLAFDASLEEVWMAFANGATLVACTEKEIRSGVGLIEFLQAHLVTVFSTVPTLLATLDGELPNLRLLILGGEVCSANLIKRWSRPDLTIINTYGPTEATVIATYAECFHDKPVTIGKPLPGYEVYILDEQLLPLSNGQQGELCIAGKGLARGYVNRPEITAEKFIVSSAINKRLYRTGDLAMINENGDIVFLGRVDDQIKLRGFRIELNEIETVIMEFGQISQVAVSLQELGTPTLVAYLQLKKNQSVDLSSFKDFLRRRLPHFMVPPIIEILESFPLLPSGKINRKALPMPKAKVPYIAYVAPKTELEKKISRIWEKELQLNNISVDADLFYDLGGHSLSAAQIVSNLRKTEGMQDISILDLYLNPTIKRLSQKVQHSESKKQNVSNAPKYHVNKLSYSLCTIGQFFGSLLQFALSAWQLLAVVLCYSWVVSWESPWAKESLFIFFGLFLCMPIVSLTFTIAAKWILLGRVKPGVYKLWGWFYFRWWLVERLQKNIFSPHHLIGSPLIILYYRLLGAKIGKDCYIGSTNVAIHDLLTIGDNSSIGFDARLLGYVVEDGWLKIGSITIGNKCYIGARSVVSIHTKMHDNSKLDEMSMLNKHAHIPANQFYSGSPAIPSIPSADHITNQHKPIVETSLFTSILYSVLHYCCLVFTMIIYYVCYFPALLLITHFHEKTHYLLTVTLAAPLGAIIFLILHYSGIGISKKFLMKKITPGTYSLKSLYYLRQWTIVKMVDVEEVAVMADTLYFPYFMKFLGAKLGKHVEMGETPHVLPDLITIQDEGFIASSVALAWPNVYLGSIKFAPIQVGKRGFVGNDSLLPSGAQIGEGGLLGCMSITPPNNKAADKHTSWLGSPPVFLPQREMASGYSDKDKFVPSKQLYNTRLVIEFIRIIMPTTFNLIGLFNMLYILNILFAHASLTSTFLALPVVEMLVVTALVASIVGLKWILLGRLKPATKPIWDIFIWKNDIIGHCYHYFINPNFLNIILGTPFASLLLRCMGAKIGKKVFIDTTDFTELDLTSIGDEVCINSEAVVQTHLYEDRIFKMGNIDIRSGCNIGVGSIVLYNTVMEANVTLDNFSLLMKGEHLPTNTNWQGVPAQPMNIRYKQSHFE